MARLTVNGKAVNVDVDPWYPGDHRRLGAQRTHERMLCLLDPAEHSGEVVVARCIGLVPGDAATNLDRGPTTALFAGHSRHAWISVTRMPRAPMS